MASQAYSINNRGQIAGMSNTLGGGTTHAIVWDNGMMIDLGTLGGEESFALGINARGQVAGWSMTDQGKIHACLWDNKEH